MILTDVMLTLMKPLKWLFIHIHRGAHHVELEPWVWHRHTHNLIFSPSRATWEALKCTASDV